MGGERLVLLSAEDEDEDDGSTICIVDVVKTVSFRPTITPSPGCCSQPACMAMRTAIVRHQFPEKRTKDLQLVR